MQGRRGTGGLFCLFDRIFLRNFPIKQDAPLRIGISLKPSGGQKALCREVKKRMTKQGIFGILRKHTIHGKETYKEHEEE